MEVRDNLCKCGCGQELTKLNKCRGRRRGFIKWHRIYDPTRHGRWNGGRKVRNDGYILVRCVGHPRAAKDGHYVMEHILIMEKSIGRYLYSNEHVHHINENKSDNRLENLQLVEASEHTRLHNLGKPKFIPGSRRCIKCGNNKTYSKIGRNNRWVEDWRVINKSKNEYMCKRCADSIYHMYIGKPRKPYIIKNNLWINLNDLNSFARIAAAYIGYGPW